MCDSLFQSHMCYVKENTHIRLTRNSPGEKKYHSILTWYWCGSTLIHVYPQSWHLHDSLHMFIVLHFCCFDRYMVLSQPMFTHQYHHTKWSSRHEPHKNIFVIGVPDSKDHGANMGPTWVLSAPGGPHVGPINLAIRGMPPRRPFIARVH